MEEKMKPVMLKAVQLVVGFEKGSPLNQVPLNFSLPQKGLVALTGTNGSGKTTLLRSLLGEKTLLSGNWFWDGISIPVQKWSAGNLSKHIAYLPQEPLYESTQTVQDHWRLASKVRSFRFDLQNLASELGLSLNQRLGEMSSGQRQRAFLGRVLLQPCQLMILDEPTNHLDTELKQDIWRTLKQLSQGQLIWLATHDTENVTSYCDEMISLSSTI
ncbi:ABC transporter ATP-binding protein [bacterium]|nr:ABC transporter ATP-binding protein [bacterium]